ncbi:MULTISPECIES: hypothetical protein [Rhodococcus]|uniref:hypothetical protein n=1 Tax=Rhodococcus TaxID=1827 RepID=UPI001E4CA409|nr:hypothetical protein [Rhodococcus pyridinivorans]MCD2119216.1 hypothetical protein [Rhodococcus pyridinivorans]MCZ4627617.1 hypothetical protein [Rhodococcus pyridinivorans]MCZ4648778.1 hypothetical protein [Rhodococcus pyridinivorans]MDJ0481370.1 hypothetical protein [Rhodococcus pyridinivorans]MDV7254934.1 hypothetical protein [Rhodococcus pyridinivorans]
MPIDTFIAGNPTDIRRVEDWIRTTLGTTIGNVADAAARARRIADDAWEGDASETYLGRSSEHVHAIDDFHARTSKTADVFADLSDELSRALSDMADIRARALAAGLPVVCNTIGNPPPGDDEAAFRRTSAYQEASDAAEAVHARWSVAVATATNTWTGHLWSASFLVSTALDYVDKNLQGRIADLLTMQQHLQTEAIREMERSLSLSPDTPYDELRRLFGSAREPLDDLVATTGRLDDMASMSRTAGRAAGTIGLVAGVGLDYFAGGESLEQAVVSNGLGLGASIAAGSAAGAMVGSIVPGAGTAFGAVVGAAAGTVTGIFTSGAVDNLYESSTKSIGGSFSAGLAEVGSAASATKELAGASIGGLARLGRGAFDAIF